MFKEDSDRLARAAAIAAATRGPDYSVLNRSIGNAKSDNSKGEQAQQVADARMRFAQSMRSQRGEKDLGP